MFKDAKNLAQESILARLSQPKFECLTPALVQRLLDLAWMHQTDAEPRQRIRAAIKDEISKAALLSSKEDPSLED
jgi:hypothetical protein